METVDRLNLNTVAQAAETTLNLLLYWDRQQDQ